jgi:hypothetical protein
MLRESMYLPARHVQAQRIKLAGLTDSRERYVRSPASLGNLCTSYCARQIARRRCSLKDAVASFDLIYYQ